MTKAPQNAPACFAAASVFSHNSEVCKRCNFFASCAEASMETLKAIQGVVNVEDLMRRHEKARKVSQAAIKAQDEKRLAERPPGNISQPLTKPVERQTQVVAVKFDVTPDDERIIATLSAKSQKIAVTLCKTGFISRIKKDVAEGRNTFAKTGPAFIREALELLINGGFTRASLRERLAKELQWNDGTAASHVSQIIPIIVGFGIASEIEGRIVPAPASEK